MEFTKQGIAEFKSQRQNYISLRTNLSWQNLRKYFYSDKHSLSEIFPGINIKYCAQYRYGMMVGQFQVGLKYIKGNETYYMFLASNNYKENPNYIAIGKAINGKLYLIRERFNHEDSIAFIEMSEECIESNKKMDMYINDIIVLGKYYINKAIRKLNDEDVKCIEMAYDAIKAFSQIIE